MPPAEPAARPVGPARDFFGGVFTLGRGLALMVRRPRILAVGIVPPLITSVLFVGVLIALILNLPELTRLITPFDPAATSPLITVLRVLAGIALTAAVVLIMVIGFSALTLALGAPLYDKIAELTEAELGGAPEPAPERLLPGAGRALRQGLALFAVGLLGSIVLFATGYIPVVGQTVVPVLGACFGGWLLAIELLAPAFDRRGLFLVIERRRAMARRRPRTLGFAIPSFLLVAIPFVSVLAFPAATAGATMLARDLLARDLLSRDIVRPSRPAPR